MTIFKRNGRLCVDVAIRSTDGSPRRVRHRLPPEVSRAHAMEYESMLRERLWNEERRVLRQMTVSIEEFADDFLARFLNSGDDPSDGL